MAILPDFPGLRVEIIVAGTPLQEYDLPNDTDEVTTNASTIKYVEATPGAEFAVHVTVDRKFKHAKYDLDYRVTIDGNKDLSRGKLMTKKHHVQGRTSTLGAIKFASGKQVIKRNFFFSTLTTGHFFSQSSHLSLGLTLLQLILP